MTLKMEDVINTACPWSGEPVAADSLTCYRGSVVGFCNPHCRDTFDRAITVFDSVLSHQASNPAIG